MRGLIVGDPTSASPLVWEDSPYNVSHTHIQDEVRRRRAADRRRRGHDRDAMKDPAVLRTMEKFQRYLERDPDIGYSFSLADILRSREHGVPRARAEVGRHPEHARATSARRSSSSSRARRRRETAKYVTPDYTTAHVTFFAKNHKGDNIAPHHRALQGVHRGQPDGEGDLQAGRRSDRRAGGGERGAGAQRPHDELPRLRDHATSSCCSPTARGWPGSTCCCRCSSPTS